eukprot:2811599-Lingulodinium_polyedra.AAC.1
MSAPTASRLAQLTRSSGSRCAGAAVARMASLTLAARCGRAPSPPPTGSPALSDLSRLRWRSA